MKQTTVNPANPLSGEPQKTNLLSRNLVIIGVITLFLLVFTIFVHQYRQYTIIEENLRNTHARTISDAVTDTEQLYKLFNETDLVFRIFTMDFDNGAYLLYKDKLDSISMFIDSLSVLSTEENLIDPTTAASNFEARNQYANEFAVLKKTMDELILNNEHDSNPFQEVRPNSRKAVSKTDTVVSSITQDLTASKKTDTVVRKRESLFNRIFRAKNDTILVKNASANQLQHERMEILTENQSTVMTGPEGQYSGNIQAIQSTFRQLQEKERLLLLTNFELLSQLKAGIDHLRIMEFESIRNADSRDFSTYRENSRNFRTQLIFALVLLLLMILLLVYYQRRASLWEHQLIRELDYSKKLADEKTNILANISHEIRTPLNALMNISEMLKSHEGSEGDQERSKLAESSYYQIQMITNTVNDILQISKIEAGDHLEEQVVTDFYTPRTLLGRIIALHQNQAKLKKIVLDDQYQVDRKLSILGDEFKTGQILSNLIGNAIKYTGNGGKVSITTTLKKEKDQNQLCIAVMDTGIGIDDKHQQQIFRKYYTANNTTGFGLGLYLSKRMADAIGATIQLSSRPGYGSTFTLCIPLKETRIAEQLEEPVVSLQSSAIPEGLRILAVDDNPVNLLYIKHILKKSAVVLDEAHDVKSAINILKSKKIDFIITDIHLPELSGWDLLQYVKSDPALKEIGVFSMSANQQPTTPAEAASYRFDGFLGKPINEHDLVSAILSRNGKASF